MSRIDMFVIGFSGLWAFIGIIFLVVGIVMISNWKKKEVNCTAVTSGKVIDIAKHESNDMDNGYTVSWYPVFEYNIGEQKFRKESAYGESRSKYTIGQNVEIYYNPENYNEYYVPEITIPKKLSIIFIVAGTAAIMISILVVVIVTFLGITV